MKLIALTTVLLLSAVSGSVLADVEDKICVLNFERRIHPFSKIIKKTFDKNKQVELITEAKPIDFFKCIEKGATEITIIAHSFQIDKEGKKFRLGYYDEVFDDKKVKTVNASLDQMKLKLAALEKKNNSKRCVQRTSKSRSQEIKKTRCRVTKSKIKKLKKRIADIENLDNSFPIYNKELFYNKVFSKSYAHLEKLKANKKKINLKNIRLMGCTPDEVLQGHKDLKRMIDDFNIGLDVAPKQRLMTLLKGKDVTTLDKDWLATSSQFDDETDEKDGFFAYVNLNTILVYRSGKAKALRGKYEVKVKGLALGLASKWSSVFIRFKDVEGMDVGEVRKINSVKLDLQLALWANVEFQLGRKVEAFGTSEINSVGASIGLFESVKIKRIY